MERSVPETVEVESTLVPETLEEKCARLEHENALLTTANANLTGGFLTVMKDLRKYSAWITRAFLMNAGINQNQYNEALGMAKTLDEIAKAKGWDLMKEDKPAQAAPPLKLES